MKRFKNILVATDTRYANHPIVDEAAEIAERNGASLKIVDVVPEFPWTVRLTLKNHRHMRDLIAGEKREKLEALTAPLRERGLNVEFEVLEGKTSVEIIRAAMQGRHDLVMRVAKGEESRNKGFFGNTGISLLRKCPCTVWLVTPTRTKFQHVLGCVDPSTAEQVDHELNDKVFELAKSISSYHDGSYSIIHAWSVWNWQMLKSRMEPKAFEEMEQAAKTQTKKTFGEFLKRHESTVDAGNVHLIHGEPWIEISNFVCKHEVDLVVMGTVGRSGVKGMIMGNTAERILNSIQCSVLALKPQGFVSPVQLDD